MAVQALGQCSHKHIVQILGLKHIVEVVLQDEETCLAVNVLEVIIHHISLVIHAVGVEYGAVIRHILAVVVGDAVGQRSTQLLYVHLSVVGILVVQHGITGEDIVVLGSVSLGTNGEIAVERLELDVAGFKKQLCRTIVEACDNCSLNVLRSSSFEVEAAVLHYSRVHHELLTVDDMLQINFLYRLRCIAQRVASEFTVDGEAACCLCESRHNAHACQCK